MATHLLTKATQKYLQPQNGLTALLAAASAERTDVVKLLLERGANIDHVDRKVSLCELST